MREAATVGYMIASSVSLSDTHGCRLPKGAWSWWPKTMKATRRPSLLQTLCTMKWRRPCMADTALGKCLGSTAAWSSASASSSPLFPQQQQLQQQLQLKAVVPTATAARFVHDSVVFNSCQQHIELVRGSRDMGHI